LELATAKLAGHRQKQQFQLKTTTMPAPVILNVYDLTTQMNSWTYWCGVGVFHAGVEVHGIEYAFGGKCWAFAFTGDFMYKLRNASSAVMHRNEGSR
jgi:hypothetical protein